MIRKFAALVALLLASFVVAPGLVAPSHAADDYTAGVRTSCHIAVPAVVRVDTAPRITITVRPNAPAPAAGARAARADQPSGTVEVSITRNGTGIFARSVPYRGRAVTIQGPVITQPGHYVVHARFRTADGTIFKSCQNTDAFNVRAGQSPDDNPPPNGGDQHPDGLLPDTGGPDLRLLILALVFVGAGSGLIYASRKRSHAPLYDV